MFMTASLARFQLTGQPFPAIDQTPYRLTMSRRDFFWFSLMPPGGPQRLGSVSDVGA